MLCSHLEIGGWKAKDNLEFLTQIGESSADVVVGITERFKGQNVERIEQRVRSNCPKKLYGRREQVEGKDWRKGQ